MTEDDRKGVYMSLLRGIANEAQDRLCASDELHVWGPWKQTALMHDVPELGPLDAEVVENQIIRVKSERHCLNCGKWQLAR